MYEVLLAISSLLIDARENLSALSSVVYSPGNEQHASFECRTSIEGLKISKLANDHELYDVSHEFPIVHAHIRSGSVGCFIPALPVQQLE
eukprot:scaffold508893_cov40-Prasinocladus_malaysianus.AAC.1